MLRFLLYEIVEIGLKLAMSIEQSGAHGSFGDSKDLADVRMLKTLDVVKGYNGAVIFRQLHHRLVQTFLKFMKSYIPKGAVPSGCLNEIGVVLDSRIHIVQTENHPASPLLEEIEGHVHRD